MTDDDKVLTPDEAAVKLRVKPSTVRQMTRDGRLPRIRGIGRIRIPRRAVEALIEEYDADDAEPDGQARTKAPTPRRGYGGTPAAAPAQGRNAPGAREAVGSGGPLPGRRGPAAGDVVVRRVEI